MGRLKRFVNAQADWLARFLSMEQGVPNHDTFGRVFARLDTGHFLTARHGWLDEFCGSLRGKGIAIDGKAHRGSHDTAAGQSPLHSITAFYSATTIAGVRPEELVVIPQAGSALFLLHEWRHEGRELIVGRK